MTGQLKPPQQACTIVLSVSEIVDKFLLTVLMFMCSGVCAATSAHARKPATGRPGWAATAGKRCPNDPEAAELLPDGYGSDARSAW